MKPESDTQVWQELRRERAYDGYRKTDLVIYRLPNGVEKAFDIGLVGETVAVLALTPEREVILAEQYRPGPGKVLLELPGGGQEAGEQPLQAAARELLEETGYAGTLNEAGAVLGDAYSDRLAHIFVATDCVKVAEQKLDEGELVKVRLISLAQFRELLRSGQMTDINLGYLGLDHLGLLGDALGNLGD